ncbi:hypothetical protein ACNKHV_04840 [Shigella flexneri]
MANMSEYRRSVAIDTYQHAGSHGGTAVGWFAHSLRRLGFPSLICTMWVLI